MENREFLPVYTTEVYDEIGVKMTYDINKNMYIYTGTDEEVGEGYHVVSTNQTMLSPEIVSQLIEEGILTYTDPLAKPEPEAEEPQCDCKEDVYMEETFEESVNHRLYHLEDKIGQILEALTVKPTKTKK